MGKLGLMLMSQSRFRVRSLVIVSGFLIGEVEMSSFFLKPKGQISTVQAYFKLQRQAPELVPYIARLEYDINEEIGVPFFKVAALSVHHAGVSNWTNVVFGFCSYASNNPISPVSLSVLKSSLVDLFLQQYNMTLTSSIFGETSSL
ncbi:uncharacterized protein LOC142531739 isoform X3 [Primulina tabacum]|uniref:uncharacterized protein LOC142531739 isoform X3 n=1 Tax=Primulina tabacum TaxID=48773 RepID=UPI003F5AA9FF